MVPPLAGDDRPPTETTPAGDGGPVTGGETGTVPDDANYLQAVMAEIDQEVQVRRASGDLPKRVERELDELFLEFSPRSGGHGGEVPEVLRMVDASAFINPVVPVASEKSGGAVIKRTLRSLNLWYVDWVVQQVNQFSSAVSRCLHVVDDRLGALEAEMMALRPAVIAVVEQPGTHGAEAWWATEAVSALAGVPGRVLHGACGEGWLVKALAEAGADVYGIDPRPGPVDQAEAAGLDVRSEPLLEHLRFVAPLGLGGVAISGLVESMTVGEDRQLLDALADRLPPGGVVVIHSMSPRWWTSDEAPMEADLVNGRPLRSATWCALLEERGFEARVTPGPTSQPRSGSRKGATGPSADDRDFLVVGRRLDAAADVG